eukprot:gnl/Dysnectes_brevis/531_a588_6230.p1 GENE.gnl/Dysnectes_brevis/531_a588_6230~~gnl/Dysnectes_brevis/531_a588_6230.p1  ORF type:complete len:186 (-),score=18.06 gnl/Dysnectes_brevis/531_a588_6230:33-590(-)
MDFEVTEFPDNPLAIKNLPNIISVVVQSLSSEQVKLWISANAEQRLKYLLDASQQWRDAHHRFSACMTQIETQIAALQKMSEERSVLQTELLGHTTKCSALTTRLSNEKDRRSIHHLLTTKLLERTQAIALQPQAKLPLDTSQITTEQLNAWRKEEVARLAASTENSMVLRMVELMKPVPAAPAE